MTGLRAFAAGTNAIIRRDAKMFVSYRARVVAQLLTGFFTVALFYYVSRLVHVREFQSPDAYFAFAVVGVAIMELVASTLSILPMKVRQELVAGTFERLVVSPFGPVASIAASTVFPLLLALATGVVTLMFAAVAFGMPLSWSTVGLALPAGLLAAVAFVPFALLVSAAVLAFKQAGSLSGFIVTGLSLAGGFLFPVALLPAWIRWISDVQPFTPAVDLLRHLIVATPLSTSAWIPVVKLVGFGAALLPIGWYALVLAVRFGQRRGTVIEY